MDRMLNIEQVAERLGTSPRFVRRLVAERRIAFNKVGRHIRFNTSDVEDFISAGHVEPYRGVDQGPVSARATMA